MPGIVSKHWGAVIAVNRPSRSGCCPSESLLSSIVHPKGFDRPGSPRDLPAKARVDRVEERATGVEGLCWKQAMCMRLEWSVGMVPRVWRGCDGSRPCV